MNATTPEVSPQERDWAMFANLAGLLALFNIPFANLAGVLVVYFKVRGENWPFAREHARNALNFQITFSIVVLLVLIVGIAVWLATIFGVVMSSQEEQSQTLPPEFFGGFAIFGSAIAFLVLAQLANVVCSILGAVAASSGRAFHYFAAVQFIK